MRQTIVFPIALAVFAVNQAQAAWQFSASQSLAPVEFGSPATFEMRISNIGDSDSPPSTLFALKSVFDDGSYSTAPLSECSAWRGAVVSVPKQGDFGGDEFDIPTIPAGGSISCRYSITQTAVSAVPLTLRFRVKPNILDSSLPQQTLLIGALGDFSATATLQSDQFTNNQRVRRFRLQFNNASPHEISNYAVSRCLEPPVAVSLRVDFEGACRTNGSGPLCFMGSYPRLRGDNIPANSSSSCDVDVIGENITGLSTFGFMQATRADGRWVLDTNEANDRLVIVGGLTTRVAAPSLNRYGVLLMVVLLGCVAARRLHS